MPDAASTMIGLGGTLVYSLMSALRELAGRHAPAFKIPDMLEDNSNLHLQCLQKVAEDVIVYGLLSFGSRQRNVSLLQ